MPVAVLDPCPFLLMDLPEPCAPRQGTSTVRSPCCHCCVRATRPQVMTWSLWLNKFEKAWGTEGEAWCGVR